MKDGGVARFWREIPQRYNLIGDKCGSCAKIFFPPRETCPFCRRKSIDKMHKHKLNGQGEIITYTIIHSSSEDFKEQVPYPIAIIKIEEGPKVAKYTRLKSPNKPSADVIGGPPAVAGALEK